ncbi:Fe-S cluster assembly protein HesB [Nocardioides humi]|uniref:Fe-S cluster assembly protein HesB n=1 Tax=Nocardioides humi TaxID=449461 RepID=UPI00112EE13B|nr:Fe-S cluster assembly protein HesB [Nocardioides humi]
MVTITPRALAIIERVTAHPALKPTSGLRIARREDPSAPWEVRAVDRPSPGDDVIERQGARLILGPDTAQGMENQVLDATTDPDGRVQFVLRRAA